MPVAVTSTGSASLNTSKLLNAVTKPVIPVKPVMVPTNIFTPKPGGTAVGNAIRDIASELSGGHFGQGEAKIQPGETNEQYTNRLLQAVGSAAQTFKQNSSNSSNSSNMADSFKSGVTTEAVTGAIKTYAPTLIVIGVGIWAVRKFILKKGGSKRRY